MKLNLKLHIKEKISKVMKEIGIIKKLSNILPRKLLITIYKLFVKPQLDYGCLISEQASKELFCHKIESVQCNASVAIESFKKLKACFTSILICPYSKK